MSTGVVTVYSQASMSSSLIILDRIAPLFREGRILKRWHSSTQRLMIFTKVSNMTAGDVRIQTVWVMSGYSRKKQSGCMSEAFRWCKSITVPHLSIRFPKLPKANPTSRFDIRHAVNYALTVESAVFIKIDHLPVIFIRLD